MTPSDPEVGPPTAFEVASPTGKVHLINNRAVDGAESMVACLASEPREEFDRSTECLLDRGGPRWCGTWQT